MNNDNKLIGLGIGVGISLFGVGILGVFLFRVISNMQKSIEDVDVIATEAMSDIGAKRDYSSRPTSKRLTVIQAHSEAQQDRIGRLRGGSVQR